jgi:hypothetical protein
LPLAWALLGVAGRAFGALAAAGAAAGEGTGLLETTGKEDILGDWFSWVTRGLPRVNGELRTLDTILIIGFAVVTTGVVVVTGAGVVVGARVVVVIGGCVVISKKVIAGRVTGAAVRSNSLKGAIVFTTTVVSGGEVVVGAGVVVVVTRVVTIVGEGVTNWGRDTIASSTTSLPSLSLSIISIIFLISIM